MHPRRPSASAAAVAPATASAVVFERRKSGDDDGAHSTTTASSGVVPASSVVRRRLSNDSNSSSHENGNNGNGNGNGTLFGVDWRRQPYERRMSCGSTCSAYSAASSETSAGHVLPKVRVELRDAPLNFASSRDQAAEDVPEGCKRSRRRGSLSSKSSDRRRRSRRGERRQRTRPDGDAATEELYEPFPSRPQERQQQPQEEGQCHEGRQEPSPPESPTHRCAAAAPRPPRRNSLSDFIARIAHRDDDNKDDREEQDPRISQIESLRLELDSVRTQNAPRDEEIRRLQIQRKTLVHEVKCAERELRRRVAADEAEEARVDNWFKVIEETSREADVLKSSVGRCNREVTLLEARIAGYEAGAKSRKWSSERSRGDTSVSLSSDESGGPASTSSPRAAKMAAERMRERRGSLLGALKSQSFRRLMTNDDER